MREVMHFIDGQAVAGTSGHFSDVFNPNTGDVQARVALATAAEVDLAVQSAARAQVGWAASPSVRLLRAWGSERMSCFVF